MARYTKKRIFEVLFVIDCDMTLYSIQQASFAEAVPDNEPFTTVYPLFIDSFVHPISCTLHQFEIKIVCLRHPGEGSDPHAR